MKLKIDLFRIIRLPLLLIAVLVFVLTFLEVFRTSGLLFALIFAPVTTFASCAIFLGILSPHGSVRSVFEFTPDRLTQTVKGKVMKDIPLGSGLHVYKSVGLTRATLVFSRVELAQAELLGKWKKHPDVVILPYFPKKMPKLKRYHDKAKMI